MSINVYKTHIYQDKVNYKFTLCYNDFMSLLKPKSLEEKIISLLADGQCGAVELLQKIGNENGSPTKQGFYAALQLTTLSSCIKA
jgi:hypothetical protein